MQNKISRRQFLQVTGASAAALLLAGLFVLFDETILPSLTAKIQELFNYAG